mgnify:FL=1|jgi:hypothetical protein
MICEGFIGESFLPQPYKEIDDKNITTRSMIFKFILYYPSKNLFLAFLTAFKTFFGAVPP